MLDWLEVLEVAGVRNLTGCPFALVVWVVDHGCVPLALVIGVGLGRAVKVILSN